MAPVPLENVSIIVSDESKALFDALSKSIPEAAPIGNTAAANYLLGVLVNKEIPPYIHISRAEAYPEHSVTLKNGNVKIGWFSLAQYYYVMGKIWSKDITIPYVRKGRADGVQSQWKILGAGLAIRLVNDSDAAQWLYHNKYQANLNKMIGWKKIAQILEEYKVQMVRSASRAIKNYMIKSGIKVK